MNSHFNFHACFVMHVCDYHFKLGMPCIIIRLINLTSGDSSLGHWALLSISLYAFICWGISQKNRLKYLAVNGYLSFFL